MGWLAWEGESYEGIDEHSSIHFSSNEERSFLAEHWVRTPPDVGREACLYSLRHVALANSNDALAYLLLYCANACSKKKEEQKRREEDTREKESRGRKKMKRRREERDRGRKEREEVERTTWLGKRQR